MASHDYFNFLSPVLDHLPKKDRDRMAELWHGYEQVFANVYQKFYEVSLNASIDTLLPYETERWLKYTFNNSNKVIRSAQHVSSQDISLGINLTTRKLIKIGYDGGTPIEIDLQGVVPVVTTIAEIITKINTAFGFVFAGTAFEGSVLTLTSPTSGAMSTVDFYPASIPSQDASEFVLGLEPTNLPLSVPEYPYPYKLPYEKVVEIPELRDFVRDESQTINLEESVDYVIEPENGVISFKAEPISTLWAKRTLLNSEDPWNNFGFLMDIYEPNSRSYVSVLQGLWFAFWNGPRPSAVRSALYLLFGLPTAQEVSTVTAISLTEIQTTSPIGVIRTFIIPSGLNAIVTLGQTLTRFQPLVDGIDVFDKINKPGFVEDEVGRAGIQRFLTENATRGPGDTDETKALRMLEEHTFLPQIQVEAFVNPKINLSNVKTFLSSIQPLSKTFLFQVIVGVFEDGVAIAEKLSNSIGIDVTPNLDSNQTTFAEQSVLDSYETVDDEALDLDSDGVLLSDRIQVDVYSFAVLIDSFVA